MKIIAANYRVSSDSCIGMGFYVNEQRSAKISERGFFGVRSKDGAGNGI